MAERTSDQQLIQLFWTALGRLKLPQPEPGTWPLVGVPVLNRPDLLERLIASFDCPLGTLAIVDNSGGRSDAEALALRALLESLERQGHADIGRIRVARAFGNAGVAAAWNQILLGFPEAPVALILNNDIQMAPGVMGQALERIDADRPQLLPLLPAGAGFSAFAITALAWDRVWLFDEDFHPACCEDLDYHDRMRSSQRLELLDGSFANPAMAAMNPEGSATIASDPELARQNARSFQLNRLHYLDRRRSRGTGAAAGAGAG